MLKTNLPQFARTRRTRRPGVEYNAPMPEAPPNPRTLSNVQNNVIHKCVRIREKAKISQRELEERLGLAHGSIPRWERGRWLKNADEIVAGYAALTPFDPGSIWRCAVKSWHAPAEGSPKFLLEKAAAEFEKSARRRTRERRSS
jgi:transcriptional regulator with XRE-family HTH domain